MRKSGLKAHGRKRFNGREWAHIAFWCSSGGHYVAGDESQCWWWFAGMTGRAMAMIDLLVTGTLVLLLGQRHSPTLALASGRLCDNAYTRRLAASRAWNVTLVCRLYSRTASTTTFARDERRFASKFAGRKTIVEEFIFSLNIFGFGLASFPTASPVAYQELEAKRIHLHTWLEAYTQISEVHLVLIRVIEE